MESGLFWVINQTKKTSIVGQISKNKLNFVLRYKSDPFSIECEPDFINAMATFHWGCGLLITDQMCT